MDLAWICASLSRFREMSVLWKTSVFSIFLWPDRNFFQVAANRTILKIDAFHITHIEADVPNFSKHLWILAIPRKLWVPDHSEVRWSGTTTAKKSVFRPLFGRKWFVSPNWPHEPPPSVIHGWKAVDLTRGTHQKYKSINSFHPSCKASDFLGHIRNDIFHYTETLSYSNILFYSIP